MEIFESSIFDLSPIPMWLEDYSEVKQQFDIWKQQGVEDLAKFLLEDQNRITLCSRKIKILQVNHKTLEIFEAQNLNHICDNLQIIFKQEMFESHIYELVALWKGQKEFSSTTTNYTLTGKRLDIKLRGVILPGAEHDLSRILLTTEDITDYKNASRMEEKNRILAESRFNYSPSSLWVEDFSRVKMRKLSLKSKHVFFSELV